MKWKFIIPVVIGLLVTSILFAFIYVTDIRHSSLNAIVEKSRAILLNTEAVREEMETKWDLDLFTVEMLKTWSDDGRQDKVLASVPVVSSWQSAQSKAEEGGYEFRVRKIQPRNPANEPDPLELEILQTFREEGIPEYFMIDKDKNAVRYFRPVILGESCLICHGDPALSQEYWGNNKGLDPTGALMEDWSAGEVHGTFEVISSLETMDNAVRWAIVKVLFIIGVILIVLMMILYHIINRPIKVLKECVFVAQEIETGNLRVSIPDAANDETGQLVESFKAMTTRLSDITRSITLGAEQIAQASTEIAMGNQDLSNRTEQQAAALEETSSAMEEMRSSIDSNGESTRLADQLTRDTLAKSKEGAGAVQTMIQSMNEINDSSNRIANIIGVMNNIAFQTNLLALNASIEAARAGEQGKGFAVVAVEVRKLAKRSDKAAGEITEIIKASNGKVMEGVDIANTAGHVLTEIQEAVAKVASLVGEISSTSQEQQASVEEINETMTSLDDNTQRNAALVEQAASATKELSDQAQDLTHNMKFFKID